jgi:hypothetical protein
MQPGLCESALLENALLAFARQGHTNWNGCRAQSSTQASFTRIPCVGTHEILLPLLTSRSGLCATALQPISSPCLVALVQLCAQLPRQDFMAVPTLFELSKAYIRQYRHLLGAWNGGLQGPVTH